MNTTSRQLFLAAIVGASSGPIAGAIAPAERLTTSAVLIATNEDLADRIYSLALHWADCLDQQNLPSVLVCLAIIGAIFLRGLASRAD